LEHKPREMAIRQPIPHVRRQQELLISITRQEVLRHPRSLLNDPDGSTTYATASKHHFADGVRRRSARPFAKCCSSTRERLCGVAGRFLDSAGAPGRERGWLRAWRVVGDEPVGAAGVVIVQLGDGGWAVQRLLAGVLEHELG